MKLFAIIFTFFTLQVAQAKERGIKESLPSFEKDSIVNDSKLKKDQSVFHFQFKGVYDVSQTYILDYSVDGVVFKDTLRRNFSIKIPTKYGKHQFQFYLHNDNIDYEEVYSGNLLGEVQKHHYFSVNLRDAGGMIMVDKPVIYCYPTEKTEISIKLKVNGNLTFTYPDYKNAWNFTADENGKIEMNGTSYNYLFWESSYKMTTSNENNTNGFCVAKEDVLSFLEDKLTEVGFTSIEKADFITFWGPKLIQNNYSVIRFMENEACNEFAKLDISPKPDHINRFYIVWSGSNELVELTPQKLTPMNRDGFTVFEWGGQELPIYLF